jgi:hypothetical protein
MSINQALNNLPQPNDKATIIDRPESIVITKKIVKFGSCVYQFHNVTGFGLAKVKSSNKIPMLIILLVFFVGAFLFISSFFITWFYEQKEWGILVFLLGVVGGLVNLFLPKRIGLELYVNSGDNVIFITADKSGLMNVISQLCEFMESSTEDIKVININQSHATIGIGYAENVKARRLGGKINNR